MKRPSEVDNIKKNPKKTNNSYKLSLSYYLQVTILKHLFFFSGVHHKKKTCEAGLVVQKVRDILSRAEGFLYPKDLVATRAVQKKRKLKLPKGNGGWGDKRDHELCLKLSSQPVELVGNQTDLN